jgi:prepilin-type N-terminal cleavage/methylation domain-containing protein
MRLAGRGLSLVELVVVMAIVGLLVGTSVAGFNIFRTPRMLDLAAAQIVADLRTAQQRARVGRTEYVVAFSVGSGQYDIASADLGSKQRAQLPRGVMITTTTWRGHRVTFSTYGNPDRTGAVHVRNRAGERVVRVDELGRITSTL